MDTPTADGKVLFCGADVAKALRYTNPQKAIKDHCKEDGVTNCSVIDSMGRTQQAKFITEGNLYRLITHSKLSEAERFEKGVIEIMTPLQTERVPQIADHKPEKT
ncbi:MAG: Bro-N domain-containing protein [Oscillospiraceae bacterium]|nr:Bro-N domain-containing protein [Oscillospiraceae bacterium]